MHRARIAPEPCAAPASDPPDYPYFPQGDGKADYQCVKVDFHHTNDADRLKVHFVKRDGARQISLLNGGLSDIPDSIQYDARVCPALRGRHHQR